MEKNPLVVCECLFVSKEKVTMENTQTRTPVVHTGCRPTFTQTTVAQPDSSQPYQVGNNVVALLLEPHQNTGGVQSTAVRQNHGPLRHDAACYLYLSQPRDAPRKVSPWMHFGGKIMIIELCTQICNFTSTILQVLVILRVLVVFYKSNA